jgi:16S rRNA (adenine1518-N6/adenine1519-N6)-dimethyltransferase
VTVHRDDEFDQDEPVSSTQSAGADTSRALQPSRESSNWWQTLNQLGIRPSKALGQNFLHDQKIVRRIADVADVGRDDLVIEVGPGLGILTRELAELAGEVIAIELDHRLAEYVRALQLPRTEVVETDVLDADFAALTHHRPYIVVANLPYSVASAAIAHMLESEARPTRMVVMVQREVAERIVARPPNMSILSVAVQLFGQPRIMFRIGPGAFVPAPKVDSAVLQIDVHDQLPLAEDQLSSFFRLVRAGFSQRRKQLRNSISTTLHIDKPVVDELLIAAAIDPRRRAETLEVEDWIRVFAYFSERDGHG